MWVGGAVYMRQERTWDGLSVGGYVDNHSARWSSSELVAFLRCDGKQDAGSSWMLIVGFMELM